MASVFARYASIDAAGNISLMALGSDKGLPVVARPCAGSPSHDRRSIDNRNKESRDEDNEDIECLSLLLSPLALEGDGALPVLLDGVLLILPRCRR